tara:strand:+ start:279 stop:1091 length:813 start_codon:yes stop_codon:yes gene_type:complete
MNLKAFTIAAALGSISLTAAPVQAFGLGGLIKNAGAASGVAPITNVIGDAIQQNVRTNNAVRQSQSSTNIHNNGNLVNPVQYDPVTGNKINNKWNWDENAHVERSPRTVRADHQAMERIRAWEKANMPEESQWFFSDSHNPRSIWTHPANKGFNRPGGNFWEEDYNGVARDVHGQTDQVGKLGVSKIGTPDPFSDPGTGIDQINGVKNLNPHPSIDGLQIGSDGWGVYRGRRVKAYSPLNLPDFDSTRSGSIEFALHVPDRDGGTTWYYQ